MGNFRKISLDRMDGTSVCFAKWCARAELKSIRIAVPMVLGELRCGHATSVYSGKGWVGVSCFGKSVRQLCRVLRRMRSLVAAKTWILCGSTLRVTRCKKNLL